MLKHKKTISAVLSAVMLLSAHSVLAAEAGGGTSGSGGGASSGIIVRPPASNGGGGGTTVICNGDGEVAISDGVYEASCTLNLTEQQRGGTALLCLYGDHGALLKTCSVKIPLNAGDQFRLIYNTGIPSDTYLTSARILVWDSLEHMIPLSDPIDLEVQTLQLPEIPQKINAAEFLAKAGILTTDNESSVFTRQNAVKTVIRMLKKEKAAAVLNDTSDFSDIEAGTTLCGEVQYCTSAGLFPADGDLFYPSEPICASEYARILFKAMGYSSPIPAYEQVLLDGIRDEPLTFRTAAQILYRSAFIPLYEITDYENSGGILIPIRNVMDGTTWKEYITWPAKYHKIYYAEGRIVNTPRSSGSITGTVDFQVEYTKNYNDSETVVERDRGYFPTVTIQAGTCDILSNFCNYAEVFVRFENQDAEFLCFAPSGQKPSAIISRQELNTSDWNFQDGDDNYLCDLEKYPLTKWSYNLRLFVNGREQNPTAENIQTYVLNGNSKTVRLEKTTPDESDSGFNVILTDYKVTLFNAFVERIRDQKIYLTTGQIIDLTECSDYRIFLNEKPAQLQDLKEGDSVSLAYDVSETWKNSSFYDIFAERSSLVTVDPITE